MNRYFLSLLTLLSSMPFVVMPAQAESTVNTEQSAQFTDECSTPDCSFPINTWSVVGVEQPPAEEPPAEEPPAEEPPDFGPASLPKDWSVGGPEERSTAGDVGVAAASCTPLYYIDGVAALVPNKGAAAIQAHWHPKNRDFVLRRLKEGASATQIAQEVMSPAHDQRTDLRQYGVVTMNSNGTVDTATATGRSTMQWTGGFKDNGMAVTTQGNHLVSKAVAANALAAYKTDDPEGSNTLSDRLMRALEAGSAAGGDRRCGAQKSASAFILVARSTDPPYATSTSKLTHTDMFTGQGPWLALSVSKQKSTADAVARLREYYDAWRINESLQQTIQSSELIGNWSSGDNQCGGAYQALSLNVSVVGGRIQGIKTPNRAYACLRTGTTAFVANNMPSTIRIGQAYRVTIFNGTPQRPGANQWNALMRVISPDLLEIFPTSPPGEPPAWFLHYSKTQ